MIILDTMVVSALMRRSEEPAVTSWFDRQRRRELWTTTIAVFELQSGIQRLPASHRRRRLDHGMQNTLAKDLDHRVLSFDLDAATAAAEVAARRLRAGTPAGMLDTQIAGIAVSRGAAIATRNVRHFEDLPVRVINPWNAPD